ncbi:SMP-30/gluconolactonase/LRE family protein [Halomonas sp. TD01]|uniref:SMP-30/gluconolactonase/LRE family protein n=1 Tax=Halomonas sp. TD01 TaxID=999141 RepID=UPI000214D65D|nr:SMP-30/gluconolactonase/LRE family protein [Halomonas sp. TD01]EGP18250.1 Senescence marker protein-30 [Halomonas sp. TD01]CAH1044411.1 gluconolactonase family protein [Halomonas sp. TD01]
MADASLRTALPVQAALGECPLWAEDEQALYWVDIEAPSLNRFNPLTSENRRWTLPENIGCVGRREGGGFIAGLRSGLWLLNEQAELIYCLARPVADTTISRFNDGRVDPWGRFWAGTIHEPRDTPAASLFRVGADLSCQRLAGDIKVSNGVAFSPDRRWAYHSDTPNHVIYRYPLDPESGELIGPREIFHQFPFGNGRPDGAAVDVEGYYWTALYEGGRIARLSPTGEIVAEYAVPARCPTMCAFGGPDLKTLYVTSARHGRPADELEAYPESGNLFAMRVDVAGQIEPMFRG